MKTVSIITLAALLGPSVAVQAFQQTFWGEDKGNGDGNPHITSWANSDAASAQFLSHLTGTGTETFEGFTSGQSGPLNINFPGAGTATLSGSGGSIVQDPGSVSVGRFDTTPGGNKFWEVSQNFTITFTTAVAAFGFYATDVGDFGGTLTLTLQSGTTKTITVPAISNVTGGSVEFFGLIDTDDPFTKVTFGDTQPGVDFFGFDDMTIGSFEQVSEQPHGTSAPDGGSTLIMLTGALGCMSYARKKKQARA